MKLEYAFTPMQKSDTASWIQKTKGEEKVNYSPPMKFKDSVPVLSTSDVRAMVDYYARVLGFKEHFIFGEPPVYAGVERDGVLLYVTHDPRMAKMLKGSDLHPDIFLWVQDVDRVFDEHRRNGAKIIEEVSDRPWDARQYVLEDPNEYRLRIAEPMDETD